MMYDAAMVRDTQWMLRNTIMISTDRP
jgi:hypothetical protein